MDITELKSHMDIVFDKEENDLANGKDTWHFNKEKSSGDHILFYPNSETLIDIFSNIQNKEKLKFEFLNKLEYSVKESAEFWKESAVLGIHALCFYTLIRLGFVEKALKAFESRRKYSDLLLELILSLLRDNFNYFDIEQLNKILKEVKRIPVSSIKTKELLITEIIDGRYELLKKKVRGVNVEINLDKKTVSEKIDYLSLDENYKKLLDEIDEFIYTNTSEFVNAAMISNLRVFLEDLFKDIAKRIVNAKEEKIPKVEGRGEMGNIRHYLKDKLDLSEKDDKFITAFVDILHSEGGHSFTSKKEYFRLARNIAIEIALLVLSKYEKKIK